MLNKVALANIHFWFREHIENCTKELRELCTNLWIHGCVSLFYYFLTVVVVRNWTLRIVRQFCDDSIHCRYFCGSNHGKTSQGCALIISYIFNRINEANRYHLSRLTKRTEANNWCFSQNADDGSKRPSDFSEKLWVSSSPRITASWPAGMNMVSRAIAVTCSGEGSQRALRQWTKGTVWELANLSCMLEKRASRWLSSRKSKPRRQSASDDFNTNNCCWYRLLASELGKVTVPETGISAWLAAKSCRWAGWSWFWKSTGNCFKNRWLMQDTLAPVSQTAVTGELQTSRFSKTLMLSMTELRIGGSMVRQCGSTAQPPRPCAGCFSLKFGTDCGSHAENVPRAHNWSKFYSP